MATGRGKTSPDVALLVRRVEMDERFRVDPKPGNNKINITGPKGEPLIVSMDADSTDFRRAERALERMGLRSAEQPAPPTTRQRVTTKPAGDPYPNITVYEKAKKVHKGATDYAKAKKVPIGLYDGVEFFIIDDKPLKYFIGKHYPKIQHYSGPGGTQEIYDFLRSTGNYARERQDDDTSAIIVRAEFAEVGGPVRWRSPRGPVSEWQAEQARKEAKVTAKEAGEDREPFPVVVTTVEERDKQAEADKAALEAIVAAGEAEEPGETTEPTGGTEPGDRGDSAPAGATSIEIGEVDEAFTLLREAITKATSGLDHASCEEAVASARQETQYQAADAMHQRRRAEKAEETLNLIWLAFSTMPQHKAVAEVLPLLPPLKDS